MHREILFKAKSKDAGIWAEGDLVRDIDNFGEHRTCIYQSLGKGEWQKIFVDPKTVCQYTGLADKNKRKIFEGDIVSFIGTHSTESGYAEGDCVGEVLWSEEELCFCVTERLSSESWEVLQECYVIGNIFDNPELLER